MRLDHFIATELQRNGHCRLSLILAFVVDL